MARREKKDSGGGDEWMSTYADMVTLLMCFFVLLYSMSTIDSSKWDIFVRSINPTADQVSQIPVNEVNNDGINEVEGGGESGLNKIEDFDTLTAVLQKLVQENNLDDQVQVVSGDNYTMIVFNNNLFFDGDSYVIKQEGREVLDFIGLALGGVSELIGELRVLGHTSQAGLDIPNEPRGDRFLASNRATQVLVYLQLMNLIDPGKMTSVGYGQHKPVAPFDTYENRAKNRRVEIFITKGGTVVDETLQEYYDAIQNPVEESDVMLDSDGEVIESSETSEIDGEVVETSEETEVDSD